MKCDFCGKKKLRLTFYSINTGLKVYECACGRRKTVNED